MSFIYRYDEIFYLTVFIAIFFAAYFSADRIINFIYQKSLGNREAVIELLDRMMVETDKKRITLILLLSSFGLGVIAVFALWPNIVAGLLFGMAITVVGWTLPRRFMENAWENRCTKVTNQMVDGLTIMANGISAGLSITQSMERVVDNMRGPLPQEFKLCLNKVRLGMTVEEALNEFGDRIPRPDVQMLVTSINILKETGGNLAETFTTIVSVVRERQKIEKKIEAMTAQGRMQATIMTLVPFVLMGVFFLLDPGFIAPLFDKALGWLFLVIMIVMQIIGGVVMKKIATIRV